MCLTVIHQFDLVFNRLKKHILIPGILNYLQNMLEHEQAGKKKKKKHFIDKWINNQNKMASALRF